MNAKKRFLCHRARCVTGTPPEIKLLSLELGLSHSSDQHSNGKRTTESALGYLSYWVPTSHNFFSISVLSSHQTLGTSGLKITVFPAFFLHSWHKHMPTETYGCLGTKVNFSLLTQRCNISGTILSWAKDQNASEITINLLLKTHRVMDFLFNTRTALSHILLFLIAV